MPVNLKELMLGRRLGISFFKSGYFSIGKDLERLIDTLENESKKISKKLAKRIVKSPEYIKEKKEIHLSGIVEIPVNLKELVVEKNEVKIRTQTVYYPRDIYSIIRLDKRCTIFFAQSSLEVRQFADFLRDITLGGFTPKHVEFSQSGLRDVLNGFDTIHRLKINIANIQDNGIKFIKLNGTNLLNSPFVKKFLLNEDNRISEIGGLWSLSSDNKMKIYLNNRGRVWIYVNPELISIEDIYSWMKPFESIFIEDVLVHENQYV